MRIGIFGGTFDPPHMGHIQAINYALGKAQLDKVLVMVTGNPYQKTRDVTAAQLRLDWMRQMISQHFSGRGNVVVDNREVRREGATYTIDTVRELTSEYPDAQLVLIVGEDIPETIASWRDGEEILEMTEIFEVPRSIVPVSSTHIRDLRKQKKSISGLVSHQIEADIIDRELYT